MQSEGPSTAKPEADPQRGPFLVARAACGMLSLLSLAAAFQLAVVSWEPSGWQEMLGTVALMSLAGLGLLLFCGAVWRGERPPFYGMLGRLSFYQTATSLTLFALLTALVVGQPAAPLLFSALVGTLLFALVAWRWLMPPGKMAALVGNVLGGITLFLLLWEGVLFGASRLVAHPLLTPLNPDSAARIKAWRLKPGSTWMGQKVNQRGYPDVERSRRKPPGVFRIVVLADSFGIGFVPYEHNFIRLLEEQLNADAQAGRRYEVVNLSVPSIGPAEYHWLLVEEALPQDPDLVICCVFAGNDFTDNEPVELGFFDRESYYSFRVLRRALAVARTAPRVESAASQAVGREFTRDDYFRLERSGLRICIPSASAELYERTLEELQRMAALASDRFLLFMIPREYQVNDAWWDALMENDPATERYNRRLPNQVLQEFCTGRGIPYADPLEELRQCPGPTYLPRDTHWNVAGNRIAAEVLAEQVQAIVP